MTPRLLPDGGPLRNPFGVRFYRVGAVKYASGILMMKDFPCCLDYVVVGTFVQGRAQDGVRTLMLRGHHWF